MGIHRQFNFGVSLYTFSFAYSNLKVEFENEMKESEKANYGYSFLASISRELFNPKAKNGVAKKKNILNGWAFSCF